jgi:hypothetical protein
MVVTEDEQSKRTREEMDYIAGGSGKIKVWAGFVEELKSSWPETHPGVRFLALTLLIMFVIMLIVEIMWG